MIVNLVLSKPVLQQLEQVEQAGAVTDRYVVNLSLRFVRRKRGPNVRLNRIRDVTSAP